MVEDERENVKNFS